jgi:hypothetical protein
MKETPSPGLRAWFAERFEFVGEEPGVLLFLLVGAVVLLFGPGSPLLPGG